MIKTAWRLLVPLVIFLTLAAHAVLMLSAHREGPWLQRDDAPALAFLALVIGTAVVLTHALMKFTLRRWIKALRHSIQTECFSAAERKNLPLELQSLAVDIRRMRRNLNLNRRMADDIRIFWTPNSLKQLLETELPGADVIVVSNREPYVHNERNGEIVLQTPASGLVSAIEPVIRACTGTWIAHGSGSADKATVDDQDHIIVPPEDPAYVLRRIWLSEEEEEGYYHGFANEGLWPLCHLVFTRPVFRDEDWGWYQSVNQKFADAIVAEAKSDAPVILVQDYHFALLPAMIREKLPKAIVVTFWHIPWPNSEAFGICPWREEILKGLLGSSILGFHTQSHCNNFFDTVDRYLECRVDRERARITMGGQSALIHPYPISIEWPPSALRNLPLVSQCRQDVLQKLGLPLDIRLGVGVERFDYTKGIIDRFHAIARFFRHHPEWRGRFTFVQIAAPTRSKLPQYQKVQEDTCRLAEEINANLGHDAWHPIRLITEHHEQDQIFELFRAADLCFVSSLHDGMNLIAKEFVAARDDEQGVLILSTFAGASQELQEALIVNPHDTKGMADAILQALHMSQQEQKERMHLMRSIVREHNVYRWAGQMLLDAARLRKSLALADIKGLAHDALNREAIPSARTALLELLHLDHGSTENESWPALAPGRSKQGRSEG